MKSAIHAVASAMLVSRIDVGRRRAPRTGTRSSASDVTAVSFNEVLTTPPPRPGGWVMARDTPTPLLVQSEHADQGNDGDEVDDHKVGADVARLSVRAMSTFAAARRGERRNVRPSTTPSPESTRGLRRGAEPPRSLRHGPRLAADQGNRLRAGLLYEAVAAGSGSVCVFSGAARLLGRPGMPAEYAPRITSGSVCGPA
jgi:hypothetical protein